MIDNKWFCEPNDFRESWCFLILQLKDHSVVTGWEIGYGNPGELVRIIGNSKSSERGIIEELLQEIYYCRSEGITLITFRDDVFPTLRTRIILLDLKDVSLCEVKCICIEKLIEEYFLLDAINSSSVLELAKKMNIKMEGSKVKLLWNLFLRIGPMLPTGVI